ncbi:PREDICTED: 5'-nucleotidase domain-containing protein 3-like [Amphimedon queenslandica]|uniref:5'-nucleotidase domain-containing protein 3 n=1 Tax=Amphimedon queenslandica TaxID=400682 RepID=A0A1X7VPE4_AMPQE|nr:PREDICTED: 5'-nucleotidase domain-containing protein 3-like [Amphimedon queenslandica]|eukprot:XP_003383248.1 PREDICTED: 5'-nucleotidase domain-containing protein 3-like [Amphimedon queenslandica]
MLSFRIILRCGAARQRLGYKRCLSEQRVTPESLLEEYNEKITTLHKQFAGRTVSPRSVFTNSELSLRYINVYGFDYDFTLVQYTPEVMKLIYDESKKRLVNKLGYPERIKSFEYNPDLVIRGLHLDIRNGYIMKMDAYHHIQLASVHRGHRLVDPQVVIDSYGGTHIPLHIMDDHHHRTTAEGSSTNLVQFLDSFSLPEVALFVDISEYLISHNISFDPEYLYLDVEETVKNVHYSNLVHTTIVNDPDRYIEPFPNLLPLLTRLKDAGKKIFLLTNSEFDFVNRGMCHVTKSPDWRDLFDVIVCSARKPLFYSSVNRPFRALDQETMMPSWQRVAELRPARECLYTQGNISEFIKLTGWRGNHVLYIGDHLLSDLSNPSLHLGWKTCAIIPELDKEIRKANSLQYKAQLASLLAVEMLLKEHQNKNDSSLMAITDKWRKERAEKRKFLKDYSNIKFGSIFRTEKAPTYFSRRLARFANLYTSSLDNLMDFSLEHRFYPRRASLPHEPDVNFDV